MEVVDFATPYVFANARTDPDEIEDNGGLKCELKTYEALYDSKGERIILQAGTKRVERKPRERNHDSALVLTRYYDRFKELEHTQLEVRSPYIRKALRTVIKEYPGMTFETGKIIIRNELRCLFHYRNELREYGVALQDKTAAQHLLFVLNHMYNTLRSEISSYYTFMESPSVAPGIEYKHLWMVFRPGELIYAKSSDIDTVLRFKLMRETFFYWSLETEEIQYDGTDYGYSTHYLQVRRYDGYKPLEELRAFPLRYHSRKDAIVDSLATRGEKFLSLQGIHHRYYEGLAKSLSPFRRVSVAGEEDEYCIQSITVKSRIIVDRTKFGQVRPTHKTDIPSTRIIKAEPGQPPKLSQEELLICGHIIPGFSLANKRWCLFELDRIEEFEYNSSAFDSLLLAADQKTMIHSLVKVHCNERLQFDDLIQGKGKGMIFLLHGEPGVGKTLTAESVADYTRRPLYIVSSGDLGTDATSMEKGLLDALELAAHWNAIALIDEADVFLEQRSHHDLQRNGLVSVFLRVLEYYEGLLILTTNRIGVFDAAFKSRIHLAIKYPALSFESRRDLWATFITNGYTRPPPVWINNSYLDSLADESLNGRQIKNVVRTAHALAVAEGSDLRPEDLRMSLKSIKDFEEDFVQDAPEAARDTAGHDGSSIPEHRAKRHRRE